MRPTLHALAILAMLGLAACDGNPFPPDEGTDPPPPDNNKPVVVPAELQGQVQQVVYTPASGTTPASLQIKISGLDTTPLLATWSRNASLDVPGYTAFSIQKSAVDRMFIGLAAISADKSVSAAVAGDGGLNNVAFSGATFARTGAYTPPSSSGTSGSVHYAGSYAGLLNGGGSGAALLPPPPGLDPTQIPDQAGRVTGDVALTANFADNQVEGQIFNRVWVDSGFGLESVILVPTAITANGTFAGTAQRPDQAPDVTNVVVGQYGGVFGGTNAKSVAGGISLKEVYDTIGTGTKLDGALERGVFVLTTCAPGAVSPPGCIGTSP